MQTASSTAIPGVNQTAAAAVSAYDLASMPAHLTRGRIAKTMPAQTPTVRVENCLPTTTTPAAAIPTARQLDSRDQNSVAARSRKPATTAYLTAS
jgi:hypothetical protein